VCDAVALSALVLSWLRWLPGADRSGLLPRPRPAVMQTGVKLSPEMARRVEVMIRAGRR